MYSPFGTITSFKVTGFFIFEASKTFCCSVVLIVLLPPNIRLNIPPLFDVFGVDEEEISNVPIDCEFVSGSFGNFGGV